MDLSTRTLAISPSMTLQIDAKAKKMKADGLDVIGFGAGEPDFDTPSFIKDAAKQALDLGLTKYTPSEGTIELRKAICQKLKSQNGLDYEPTQIVVSNGAKHSLFNVFAAILNDGDEVILPSPYWVTYPELIQFSGGTPIYVESREENGFTPSLEDIKNAVTSKTKAIVINSPSNPTGAVYSEELLRGIADLAVANDFLVVSDEIYEELVYEGEKVVSIATFGEEIKERTIVVNGFSKAYAMTGWRLGYTASNPKIAKAMSSLQSHATSNPNSIAMYAAVAALNGPRKELEDMVKAFDKRRKLLVGRINAVDGLSCIAPNGAFYVMLNISDVVGKSLNGKKIENSMEFCDALLDDQKVAIVPGIAFGAENFCRMSYAVGEDKIERGLDRIQEFVKKLV